ncbi:MAG: AAA family ATPase, partial [Caldilineaceae bacterium]|nr:AAA family ATPase [Caldilineaceae bacterium]
MNQTKLFLFGQPRLEKAGQPADVHGRKVLALAAYLAVTGIIHNRDHLATLLWSEHDQSGARANLRRELSQLNRLWGPDVLTATRESIGLAADGDLWIDVVRFQGCITAGQAHDHGASAICAECQPLLEEAAALYQADFLAGFSLPDCPEFEEWQLFQRESLRQGLAAVLERLAAGLADAEAALGYARRWLTLDTLHEPAHQAVMRGYARAGQQAASLRQYERCGEILHAELGVAPGESTQQLAAAIRQGAFRPSAPVRATSALPVPIEPAVRRHDLPSQTTPFIGRQYEVADLTRLLAEPEVHLVTILAPGGMGKTRLSLAVAERQIKRFRDGVFFVPLAPLSSPDDIVTTIAEQLDFSFGGSTPPKQQLLDYFRERQILLVLDNFEHLLEGAPLVTDLLRAAPDLKVLATSREKLNLSGETTYLLAGLHFPTWESLEDLLEYDAIRLFIGSARRVRPDFTLQPQDFDDLARICRLTAGMPLAIVLAAGWLDLLSLAQVAAEIQRGLDILETEQRDVPERQRSMRATFSYSWERLSEVERQVFMKLAVCRGGFSLEAAEVVAGADLRTLRRLAGKSLVQIVSDGRYAVHELLRQYSAEKLRQSAAADTVRQAHSRYYLAFLAARDADIKG